MAESRSADNGREISRDRLAELLNEDLSREYQAIIGYVVYSQVLKGADYEYCISTRDPRQAGTDHALIISRQIDYLGKMPTVNPLPSRPRRMREEMLRFDLANENDTIRSYRERIGQAEALGEFALANRFARSWWMNRTIRLTLPPPWGKKFRTSEREGSPAAASKIRV